MENVIVLGTGCAGATAAVYAARANLKPVLYEGEEPGGQLTLTSTVENFPGFPEGIQGPELVELMKKQAQKFGATFKYGKATTVKKLKDGFEVTIDNKEKVQTKTIIVATGASARWMDIPSEKAYKGKGVSTCATCDAFFYKGKDEVIVIGGGDSACEEALTLAKFAKHVTIVHRRDEFRASKIMQERVLKHPNISVMWDSAVEEVVGDGKHVTSAKLKNLKTNKITDHKCDGIFLAIGHVPNTKFLEGLVDLDEKGFVKTDRRMATNVPGIWAAGDVQDHIYKQAITAAGTGCQAAMEIEKFLESKE